MPHFLVYCTLHVIIIIPLSMSPSIWSTLLTQKKYSIPYVLKEIKNMSVSLIFPRVGEHVLHWKLKVLVVVYFVAVDLVLSFKHPPKQKSANCKYSLVWYLSNPSVSLLPCVFCDKTGLICIQGDEDFALCVFFRWF